MAEFKKLRPLGKRVLVEAMEQKETVEGGIVLPGGGGGLISYSQGKIIATGEEVTKVKVGDVVAHLKYGYDEMKIGNKKLLMVEEGNVIAVYEE